MLLLFDCRINKVSFHFVGLGPVHSSFVPQLERPDPLARQDIQSKFDIDEIASQFEREWSKDQLVNFQEWIERISPPLRPKLLQELIKVDFDLRSDYFSGVLPSDYQEYGASIVSQLSQLKREKEHRGNESDGQSGKGVAKVIDNYELQERLGSGGMGEVFLARHRRFRNRRFAVKLLKPSLFDSDALKRFEHEIDVTGQLSHPNIVFAFDAGAADGEPYLVMEYVRGQTLRELLKRHGVLPVSDACELVRQAAVGLQYAFESNGLTHRDVKPSNLMLDSSGRLKVLDLGLARLRESSSHETITRAGQFVGTPDYMSPEQWDEAKDVTTTADIYSLCCTLFELIGGRPPYRLESNKSLTAKMNSHLFHAIPDIQEVRKEVPEGLAGIIRRGLSKKPEERFQTPQELVFAISPYCVGANLCSYDVSTEDEVEQSDLPTHVIKTAEESTKKNTSQVAFLKTSRPFARYGAILVILIVSALSIFGWETFSPSRNGDTKNTQFVAMRLADSGSISLGQINGEGPDGQVVYEGEHSRLEILLPESRYLMVIGFVPNLAEEAETDADTAICIWPENEDLPPQRYSGFVLGERATDKYVLELPGAAALAIRDANWNFSDGAGIHAFVAISSRKSLPCYADIRSELQTLRLPIDPISKHWRIVNGRALLEEFDFGTSRGLDESIDADIHSWVDELSMLFPEAYIDGLVFNVEPSLWTSTIDSR